MLQNLSTADLQAIDAAHHLHPFTDNKGLGAEGARIIVRGEGVYLWDSEGNRILDGMAGLWCVNVGYGRNEIADAVSRQMRELPYYNTFFKTTHPPAIELSERLAEVTPEGFNRVFFTNSGSESVDTAFRMVRYYWIAKGRPEKHVVISRRNSYHGSTLACSSLGGNTAMHAQDGGPIPGIRHIAQPYWFDEGGDMDKEEFGLAAARELENAIEEIGEDKVAAFIAEPIQGAGGVVIPPDSYWPEIQRICDEHEILLVADEVICGFGRTGRWFGSDTFGIRPDLMTMAKGLSSGYQPIGGVMVSDGFAQTLIEEGGEFYHGFTYSGHPAACAAAIANLDILQREGIVEKVASDTAPYLAEKWARIGEHPLVGEARIKGLVGALELVPAKPDRRHFPDLGSAGTVCRDISFSNGLVMRAVRDAMVVSPPLVISRAEIDEMAELIWKTLDQTQAALKDRGWM